MWNPTTKSSAYPVAVDSDIQDAVSTFIKAYESAVVVKDADLNAAGLWAGVRAILDRQT